MQGEFEKQVQQKMEELKLVPSDPVWHKVQAEIRKKKERRRILFFLFFLVIATAGVLWWTMGNNMAHTSQTTAQNKTVSSSDVNANKPTTTAKDDTIQKEKKQEPAKKNISTGKKTVSLFDKFSVTNPDKNSITSSDKLNEIKNHSIYRNKLSNRNTNYTGTINRISKKNDHEPTVINKSETNDLTDKSFGKDNTTSASDTPPTIKDTSAPVDKQMINEQKQVPVSNPISYKENKDTSVEINHTDTALKKKTAKTSKWQKIISVQTGLSGYSIASVNNSNLYLSSPTTLGGFTSSSTPNIPNRSAPGTSFAISLGTSKALTAKWQFGVSAQFHYYTTHIKTGQYIDSVTIVNGLSQNGYYTNGTTNDYTNHFSIIEIPVSFQYQPFRTPFKITLGGAYGVLLQSNALSYDAPSAIYYNNKNNISKNYFSLFSALQYDLVTKDKFRLRIGPVIQYNLSPIEQTNYYSATHFLSAGLKTDIIF